MKDVRILYAEDDYLNRSLMMIKLSRRGMHCELAEDGNVALDRFDRGTFDVVVLDQLMPGMNGDEVGRRIRGRDPRVILVGITADPREQRKMLRAGFDRAFLKPLRGDECFDFIVESVAAIKE